MIQIGTTVAYTPGEDHMPSDLPPPYAAIVGHVYPDGLADLHVMPPGKPAFWADRVQEGEGPDSFAALSAVAPAKPARRARRSAPAA